MMQWNRTSALRWRYVQGINHAFVRYAYPTGYGADLEAGFTSTSTACWS